MKPLALVRWQDAHSDGGQHAESDIAHEALIVHTIGYVLRDDDKGVSIAAEFIPESDNYRAITFIPRALVLAVEGLKRTRSRRTKV
jgi:hypothetical protein